MRFNLYRPDEETASVAIPHTPVTLQVRRAGYAPYRRAMAAVMRQALRGYADLGVEIATLDDDEAEAQMNAQLQAIGFRGVEAAADVQEAQADGERRAAAEQLVVEVTGLVDEDTGDPVLYSVVVGHELLSLYPHVYQLVLSAAERAEERFRSLVGEAEGNSGASSGISSTADATHSPSGEPSTTEPFAEPLVS